MADPRFYDNQGPFTLREICARAGVALPEGINGELEIADLASLAGAGPRHLTFLASDSSLTDFASSRAGACFVAQKPLKQPPPESMTVIAAPSPQHAFVIAAELFYPGSAATAWRQDERVDPDARVADDVILGPGVVIAKGAEIGEGTQIGANAAIGKGVAIGRHCRIGSNVTISHAYIGDRVTILPGAQIGQPGFGFASSRDGHRKVPQLGRVIVQDHVEIGSCTTIDRGALGDTVIGEGTKIDNLVQVGHNSHLGRHCMIVGQVGIAGSCDLGDFVVAGGQAGFADHVTVASGARFAGRSGVTPGNYSSGDWGGTPAVPAREWLRQMGAIALLGKRRKRNSDA